VRRRDLLALLCSAAALLPHAGAAQQKAMPVVGVLNSFSRGPNPLGSGPVAQGLSETGYVYGQNVVIEVRFAETQYDRLPALAADLVGRNVDVIVTIGGTNPALAAKGATSTIPIVFTSVSDPVGVGLVASLARPGGNVTGFSNITNDLMPKRLELLSELIPQARVIALLVNPNNPNSDPLIQGTQQAAHVKGLQLLILKARTESEIDAVFASLVQSQAGGLIVHEDAFLMSRREQLTALASRHAVPAIYPLIEAVRAGGLISYGPAENDVRRQAGIYAGRILKGEKPADLPVQQPTKFELVINLKTAKALGLTVPRALLARADEVIE
jgi:putative ABC transport system substrate-binding protein